MIVKFWNDRRDWLFDQMWNKVNRMCVWVLVFVCVLGLWKCYCQVNKIKAVNCCCLCIFVHQVCREYQRGNCTRGESDCRFAHPADSTMIDTNDNTVTVCMDYIKGRCSREKCKYFHPPAHLQAKIKAAQHQVNQAAAAAAMVGACPQITSLRRTQAKAHLLYHSNQSCAATGVTLD